MLTYALLEKYCLPKGYWMGQILQPNVANRKDYHILKWLYEETCTKGSPHYTKRSISHWHGHQDRIVTVDISKSDKDKNFQATYKQSFAVLTTLPNLLG